MFKYYISEMKTWLDKTIPTNINDENFLWLIGSLFLLGIVTKWLVMKNYGKLIRKAENMEHTKNVTLRQIKNKYDSIKEINGNVANPMLFVQRHLNKCKIMHISMNKLDNIINWCIIAIVVVTGVVGIEFFMNKKDEAMTITCVFIGCFFAFALEMINKSTRVSEKKMELTYVIVDFLSNNHQIRQDRQREATIVPEPEPEIVQNTKEQEQNAREEQILNQVIGEFLQ